MKYPFKKASFWIILIISCLISFFNPPRITPEWYQRAQYRISKLYPSDELWPTDPYYSHFPIDWKRIISFIVIIFLLDYFGHLIFLKLRTKKLKS
jgi:hypothetical protein